MNIFEAPHKAGSWGSGTPERGKVWAQPKEVKGAGSGSFLQEAVGGVLVAMTLQFPQLLLLQGQHWVHLQ